MNAAISRDAALPRLAVPCLAMSGLCRLVSFWWIFLAFLFARKFFVPIETTSPSATAKKTVRDIAKRSLESWIFMKVKIVSIFCFFNPRTTAKVLATRGQPIAFGACH